jgi:hypothetical protein
LLERRRQFGLFATSGCAGVSSRSHWAPWLTRQLVVADVACPRRAMDH